MEIICKLPKEINSKILLYLSHPIADMMYEVINDAKNYFGYEGQKRYTAMLLLNYTIYSSDEYIKEYIVEAGEIESLSTTGSRW